MFLLFEQADALWDAAIADLRLLDTRDPSQLVRLRALVARFLARKAFTGARGLEITDRMRLLVASHAIFLASGCTIIRYTDHRASATPKKKYCVATSSAIEIETKTR